MHTINQVYLRQNSPGSSDEEGGNNIPVGHHPLYIRPRVICNSTNKTPNMSTL